MFITIVAVIQMFTYNCFTASKGRVIDSVLMSVKPIMQIFGIYNVAAHFIGPFFPFTYALNLIATVAFSVSLIITLATLCSYKITCLGNATF